MFNAVILLDPPIIAVQVEPARIEREQGAVLLAELEAFFMSPVVLVAWDQNSKFLSRGAICPESMLIDEDLQWRQFELLAEPDIPF